MRSVSWYICHDEFYQLKEHIRDRIPLSLFNKIFEETSSQRFLNRVMITEELDEEIREENFI